METHWAEALKAQTYTAVQDFLVAVMLAPPSGHKCFSVTVLNRPELEPSADEGLLVEQFQIRTLLHRQSGGEEPLFSCKCGADVWSDDFFYPSDQKTTASTEADQRGKEMIRA